MNSNAMPQERVTEMGALLLGDDLLDQGKGFSYGITFDLLVFSPPEPIQLNASFADRLNRTITDCHSFSPTKYPVPARANSKLVGPIATIGTHVR